VLPREHFINKEIADDIAFAALRCFLVVALLAFSGFAAPGPAPDQPAAPRP